MKILIALAIVALALGLIWPDLGDATRRRDVPITLGDSTITASVHTHADTTFSMLVVHDDENTAVEAGLAFLEENGGRLVELRAQGERRVTFSIYGAFYDFDPNRIFTERGARATLNPGEAGGGVDTVRRFANELLAIYAADQIVVTLHNNTPDSYSARSYAEGGEYHSDAAAVHLEPGVDPDDFFFVTDEDLFDALRAKGFNVVLQNNENVTDDGSLSVWAAREALPYVNIEAEHGHFDEQKAMIEALEVALRMLKHENHTQ